MNQTVFKTPVLRYSFVVLVIACLCGIIGYLSLQYNKAEKLHLEVDRLVEIRGNSAQIDSCILTLYKADNDSRLYSVTGDLRYLHQFATQVKQVDSILAGLRSTSFSGSLSSEKISNLMDSKSAKTKVYLHLRHLSDSLIALSLVGANTRLKHSTKKDVDRVVPGPFLSDTSAKPKQKNLLGRIAGAFSRKKIPVTGTVLITDTTAVSATVLATANPYKNYYKKLHIASSGMIDKEREILLINLNIIQELISVLNRYKIEEQRHIASGKKELRGTLNAVFSGFSELSFLAGLFIVLLIVALFYNVWKIFRHQKRILAYSAYATQFAAEKSAFLANMSHEIRTPLNSIAGFAEQLEQSVLNDEQTGQIKAVRSSAGMLLNVVNQVLDFSKYETGKMNFDYSSFSIDDIVTDAIVGMGVLAEQKGLRLHSELEHARDLHLMGDGFRLKQVIINLLGNAIKFTREGTVTLKVWTKLTDAHNYDLHVSVTDTGIGIAEADLPVIFKEFTQTTTSRKQNHTGTGLGLAISRSIVELQGGVISVESRLGKGAVFSFSIPFPQGKTPPVQAGAPADEIALKAVLNNRHVLLAEDNGINVMLAKTILRKWNMTCEVAHNGLEAIKLFEKNRYDIVLTDIQMPEMDGTELAIRIRQTSDDQKAKIPILALTANMMKEDHEHYLRSGINAVALKPFLEKELIHKIVALLKPPLQIV